ncbi:MAG TPA: hypothetical protein DCM05_15580 [Elusimicrobia bacterium]|nr:hypothetical protein [Elusimicrobiota bacterium]
MLTCQREARRAFIADYERRYGRLPSNLRLDALDEHQRREAREHALRHPELATMTSETEVVVPGFLDRLKGVYQAAKSRLKGLLHKDEKPGVPSDAATLFSGGADGLKTVLDKSKWDGKRPMDVSQEIKNYNREVDENLDPAMKQYFKKKGETPR